MNINITARHFKARESYKNVIHDRLNKLKRYYDGNMDCDVVLEYRNKMQIAEFRLRVHQKTLISNQETDKMMKSIDKALDDIEGQLRKFKNKKSSINRKKITDLERPVLAEDEEAEFGY